MDHILYQSQVDFSIELSPNKHLCVFSTQLKKPNITNTPRNPLSFLLSKIFSISITVIMSFNIMTVFSALTALPPASCGSWTFHVMVLRRSHWVALCGPWILTRNKFSFDCPSEGGRVVAFLRLGGYIHLGPSRQASRWKQAST